jgi:hypothetical protein
VELQRGDATWSVQLQLELDGESSGRRLEAESCDAALDAAALVVALAIDPDAVTDPPALEDPEPPVPATPANAPDPAPFPPRPDPPRVSPRVHWAVDLGGAAAVRVAAPAAGGVQARGSAGGRRWSAGLGGTYVAPAVLRLDAGASARVQLWSVQALGCYALRFGAQGRWTAPLCAALWAGVMHARGAGPGIESRRGHSPWAALGPALAVRWISRHGVGAFIAAELPVVLHRPSFVLADRGRVCCSSPIGLLFAAGISFGGARPM